MANRGESRTTGLGRALLMFTGIAQILSVLVGCRGPSVAELGAVDYAPQSGGDWPVSTPKEQGLDPDLVARLYKNASELETLYSLLLFQLKQQLLVVSYLKYPNN